MYSDASRRRSAGAASALPAEGEVDGLLFPIPDDRELHLIARSGVQEDGADRMRAVDLLVIDLRDDVVHLESGLARRRAGQELADDDPLRVRRERQRGRRSRREEVVGDADRAAVDLAVRDELVGDVAGRVARDRETEAPGTG